MGKATDKTPGDLPVQEDQRTPLPVQSSEPVPLAVPDGGWPADEFTGLGGSYVRDPFTGIRSKASPDA